MSSPKKTISSPSKISKILPEKKHPAGYASFRNEKLNEMDIKGKERKLPDVNSQIKSEWEMLSDEAKDLYVIKDEEFESQKVVKKNPDGYRLFRKMYFEENNIKTEQKIKDATINNQVREMWNELSADEQLTYAKDEEGMVFETIKSPPKKAKESKVIAKVVKTIKNPPGYAIFKKEQFEELEITDEKEMKKPSLNLEIRAKWEELEPEERAHYAENDQVKTKPSKGYKTFKAMMFKEQNITSEKEMKSAEVNRIIREEWDSLSDEDKDAYATMEEEEMNKIIDFSKPLSIIDIDTIRKRTGFKFNKENLFATYKNFSTWLKKTDAFKSKLDTNEFLNSLIKNKSTNKKIMDAVKEGLTHFKSRFWDDYVEDLAVRKIFINAEILFAMISKFYMDLAKEYGFGITAIMELISHNYDFESIYHDDIVDFIYDEYRGSASLKASSKNMIQILKMLSEKDLKKLLANA